MGLWDRWDLFDPDARFCVYLSGVGVGIGIGIDSESDSDPDPEWVAGDRPPWDFRTLGPMGPEDLPLVLAAAEVGEGFCILGAQEWVGLAFQGEG